MIEKLARAVVQSDAGIIKDEVWAEVWDSHLKLRDSEYGRDYMLGRSLLADAERRARAVLTALREPTPEMTLAGIDSCPLVSREKWSNGAPKGERRTLDTDECGEMFTAMIDAVLEPQP